MITCNIVGGLGNQLFQIFTTISYALKHNIDFAFLNIKVTPGMTHRITYWDLFFKNIKSHIIERYPVEEFNTYNEPYFAFKEIDKIDKNKNNNLVLNGYFQSYKYFDNYKKEIFNLINLKNQQEDVMCISKINNFENIISIHFRIGDYKRIQDYHPILPIIYYIKALQFIVNNISSTESFKVIYFCEDQDIDEVNTIITELKNKFPSLMFEKVNYYLKDWQQMILMSLCKYNIIANSTFSWWGAYFNSNNDKVICYPSKWFGAKLINHNISDLFPDTWNKINI